MEPSSSLSCQSHWEKLKTHKEVWYDVLLLRSTCSLCTCACMTIVHTELINVTIILFAG